MDRSHRQAAAIRWRGSLTGIGLVVLVSTVLSLIAFGLAAVMAVLFR